MQLQVSARHCLEQKSFAVVDGSHSPRTTRMPTCYYQNYVSIVILLKRFSLFIPYTIGAESGMPEDSGVTHIKKDSSTMGYLS
jgi:hypothetical protein